MRRALAICCLVFVGFPAMAEERAVACWDQAREIVQTTYRDACRGQIVSAAEAERLRARSAATRRARVARSEALRRAEARRPVRFHSAGTAFAVNAQGDMLTSAHVVQHCDALEARLPGGRRLPVALRHIEPEIDLAVIRTAWRTPGFLRFAPKLPEDGAPVAVIGFPDEGRIRLAPRLTPAHVDYRLRDPDQGGLTGVVGDVRRGHSGGPALDSRGRVVGVLKAKIDSVKAHALGSTALKHLGVLTDPRDAVRLLERARTRYVVDGSGGRERTVRALRGIGEAAVLRIDCLRRR